jgi:hypothetical protein
MGSSFAHLLWNSGYLPTICVNASVSRSDSRSGSWAFPGNKAPASLLHDRWMLQSLTEPERLLISTSITSLQLANTLR